MFVQPVWAGVRASRPSHKAGRYAVTQACSCYQAEQACPPRHPPPAQQEGHLSVLGRDNSRGACQKATTGHNRWSFTSWGSIACPVSRRKRLTACGALGTCGALTKQAAGTAEVGSQAQSHRRPAWHSGHASWAVIRPPPPPEWGRHGNTKISSTVRVVPASLGSLHAQRLALSRSCHKTVPARQNLPES